MNSPNSTVSPATHRGVTVASAFPLSPQKKGGGLGISRNLLDDTSPGQGNRNSPASSSKNFRYNNRGTPPDSAGNMNSLSRTNTPLE